MAKNEGQKEKEKFVIPKQCKILKRKQKHEECFQSRKYDGRIVDEECHYQDGNHFCDSGVRCTCPSGGCLEQKLGLEMTRFHWAHGIIVSFKKCNANFAIIKEYIRKELAKISVKDEAALEDLTWTAFGWQSLENIGKWIEHEVQLHKHPLKKLSAKELQRLMSCPTGHPDQEGSVYDRYDVMHEIEQRGKKVLIDLGWPTKMNARYWRINRLREPPETLRQILGGQKFDGCKGMSKDIYRVLSVATDFDYNCTDTGLSCTSVKDWQKIIAKHPDAKPLLKKAIEYDKAVYEYAIGYGGGRATVAVTGDEEDDETGGAVIPLSEHKQDECAMNLVHIGKWLGIDMTKASDVKILVEADPYCGVWEVLEWYTPEKPTKDQILKQAIAEAKRDAKMKKPSTLTLDLFAGR